MKLRINVRAALRVAFLIAVVISQVRAVAMAQLPTSNEKQPAFEVASIKSANPGITSFGVSFMPASLTAHGPLNGIITVAYSIPLKQLEGDSPILKENFEIEAKAAVNSIPPNASPRERSARLRLMLQTLLQERFRLAVHKEVKERPAYALVIAKNPPTLKP